jgi:hypothetical protein
VKSISKLSHSSSGFTLSCHGLNSLYRVCYAVETRSHWFVLGFVGGKIADEFSLDGQFPYKTVVTDSSIQPRDNLLSLGAFLPIEAARHV